ncbi:MAG TPA: S53 family peptidase [Terracidiphilus sp.]|nr:S53 family peptidase [Terracidiphilus sp.]
MSPSPKHNCHPYFKHRKPRPAKPAEGGVAAAAPSTEWTVPNLCAAYNWPTGLAGGGVIAIVELGGGWVQSDINAYFQSIGQPGPSITDVSVDGTQNTPNQPGQAGEADFEVGLDIEVAAASYYVATGGTATIRVYWSQDIGTAITKAAQDGCDICSISWGADEAQWGTTAAQQLETDAETATAGGMVIFGAAGDNDSGDGGPTPANVDCPSSAPHVVGCGGTNKTANSETVWNDNPGQTNGQGTGGGYSTIFPVQSWQIGAPPAPANSQYGKGRMVPDVCADADPETGYEVFIHGSATVLGGTSAVAPLYAGLFAAFGKKLGFVTPTLWKNQGAFNDITVGSNGMYSAAVGPDPCSGIGSPIGTKIAALFAGPEAMARRAAVEKKVEKKPETRVESRPKS